MGPETRAIVAAAARRDAFDRYLAALLAPRRVRDDLMVLAAFDGDLTRISTSLGEPVLREIRRQWWRDALAAISRGERSGNPVADGFAGMIQSGRVQRDSLLGSVDAWSAIAEANGNVSPQEFDHFLAAVHEAGLVRAFEIAADRPAEAGESDVAAAAGRAIGLTSVIADPARHKPDGCVMLPSLGGVTVGDLASRARREIAAVRPVWRQLPGPARAALSPVALVGPYLDALQEQGFSAIDTAHAMTPISRVTRLWWAARIGRF